MNSPLLNIILNELLDNYGRNYLIKAESEARRKTFYRNMLLFNYINFKTRRRIPKISRYEKIIYQYPEDVFKSHFRMQRSTFKKLVQLLEPYWKNTWIGRPKVNLEKGLYICIWRLANQTTIREVADRFDVAVGCAFQTYKKMTQLLSIIVKKFVKWPKSREEMVKLMENFQNMRKERPFPNVIGCMDSTHIEIPSPKIDSVSYYNRKGTHSMILQAVCNSNLLFIDIFFGWPGRSHDASVWSNSPLKSNIENGTIPLLEDTHLLGDSAYPLSTYLMVPYRGNGYLTSTEKNFNGHLSSTRVCIEQAFGVLKSKFRILKFLPIYNTKRAKDIVMSCVVLHNFIIQNEGIDLEHIEINDDSNACEISTVEAASCEAKQKRDLIAHLFVC